MVFDLYYPSHLSLSQERVNHFLLSMGIVPCIDDDKLDSELWHFRHVFVRPLADDNPTRRPIVQRINFDFDSVTAQMKRRDAASSNTGPDQFSDLLESILSEWLWDCLEVMSISDSIQCTQCFSIPCQKSL